MTDLHALSAEDPLVRLAHTEALLDAALGTITILEERNAALAARVKQLEDRLGKDPYGPPSSDRPGKKKPNSKSLRGAGGRKPGGQKGHPGKTLEYVDEPDEVVVHTRELCPYGPILPRPRSLPPNVDKCLTCRLLRSW